jgi:integrase
VCSRAWIHADEAKGKRSIPVPLSEEAVAILEEQLADAHPHFVFVYTNNRGESAPVAKTKTKAFDKACARAGIRDLRWHDLRHTWATWHVMNGTRLEVLQRLGGWKD